MNRPRVVVVGLGPAGPELVTPQATAVIERVEHRFLRTVRHPAASVVPDAVSCDDLYEAADTFDEVYRSIVERLVGAAVSNGMVMYAVPGSPLVLERSVEYLLRDDRIEVELLAAMSFLDLAWARLGIDPVEAGVRLVDGHTFATSAAGERGPMLVAHCHNQRVLSDIKLAADEPAGTEVTVLQRLGLPDEKVFTVPWADLDREVLADHLTCIYVRRMESPVAVELVRFQGLVQTLRRECPWDSEQTHESLRRHLIEEAYEVLDAIDGFDADTGVGADELEEELGDLLFQVFLHSILAAEQGWFDLADVARRVHDKLYGRHPHVFDATGADESAMPGTDELVVSWEARKVVEKDRVSIMDGVPRSLPALALAEKVLQKSATLGLDLPVLGLAAPNDAHRAFADDPSEESLGSLLLCLAGRARSAGIDSEMALRASARRLMVRVGDVEHLAAESDIDVVWTDARTVAELWSSIVGDC